MTVRAHTPKPSRVHIGATSMRTPYTWLSLVAALFLGGCGRLNSPVILSVEGEEQPGARPYTVSLAELDEAGASAQQVEKFFEERGASDYWEKLQELHNSSTQRGLVFQLGLLQQGGVADEVMAGVIRYVAHHYPDKVKSLRINGSDDNYLTALDPAIGDLTNLTFRLAGYNYFKKIVLLPLP